MEIKGKILIQNSGPRGVQKVVMISDRLRSNPNVFLDVSGDFEGEGEFMFTLPEKEQPAKKKGKK